MDIVLGFLIWYAIGLLGSALAWEFGLRRDGVPLTIGDLCFGAFCAITGLGMMAIGALFFFRWAMRGRFDFNRVIFPAHKEE